MVTPNNELANPATQGVAVTQEVTPAPADVALPGEQQVTEPTEPNIDQISAERDRYKADLDSDRKRYAAAQRKEQDLIAQNKNLGNQVHGLIAEFQKMKDQADMARLADLPDDVQQYAKENITLKRQMEDASRTEAQRRHELDDIARPVVINKIAMEVGIPVSELEQFNDPIEMQTAGINYLKTKNQALEAKVKELQSQLGGGVSPAQTFDKGGGTGAPTFDPKKYAGTGNVADFIKDKRDAGY